MNMPINRREVLKGVALAPFLASSALGAIAKGAEGPIKPKRLLKGDTIAVIAPASGLASDAFDKAIRNLEALGYRTKIGKYARGNGAIYSGSEIERLHDLHSAFSDREVQGVWCVRGGNGSQRLLPQIDHDLIRANPKVFVGYSDITALHTAIHQKCGLVTFHGPVAAPIATSTYSEYTKAHLLSVLMGTVDVSKIECSEFNKSQRADVYTTRVITSGKARGRLVGGNLTLLSSLAGTPWALENTKDKILFLEAVDEFPWRVERMLLQLKQSLDMRALAGIAIGILDGCVAGEKRAEPPVFEVIKDSLGALGIPVIYGLSFGHIRDQCTLPIGVEAELDTEAATITLLEAGVK